MKLNIRNAVGRQLDWLVAKCEGGYDLQLRSTYGAKTAWQYTMLDEEEPERMDKFYLTETSYSTDWQLGGPIIEREGIQLRIDYDGVIFSVQWIKDLGYGPRSDGPTPLIAAMRCYVTSKLGEEVEIPSELLS